MIDEFFIEPKFSLRGDSARLYKGQIFNETLKEHFGHFIYMLVEHEALKCTEGHKRTRVSCIQKQGRTASIQGDLP